jgi:hypothetical protein
MLAADSDVRDAALLLMVALGRMVMLSASTSDVE